MRLADYSAELRRQRISFALDVVLQDLAAPEPTIEVARRIAARLETSGKREIDIICQMLARHIGPRIPQAAQTPPDKRGRRHWIWSPKAGTPFAAIAREADKGLTLEERRAIVDADENGWSA